MTNEQRISLIIQTRGSDPDIQFLLNEIDTCATVLGNLMVELDRMNPKPAFEDYSTSHARALATYVERGSALVGFRGLMAL